MSSSHNNTTVDIKKELNLITSFVDKDPAAHYLIEKENGRLCRLGNSKPKECLELSLTQAQMFKRMQDLDFFCTLSANPRETYLTCRRL
ncbi:hypothetical protein DSO57_1000151 [Entomophthora muscae]|uniref:Uncharacterized protein n=1 Tax=Entomophthora muscae TaxID=34485 RepID=A0ACC2T9A6_9FUNG|nr:hypothetical protein DSO57_1000151 [Entomophthora muscae]